MYGSVIAIDGVQALNEHGYPVLTPTAVSGSGKICPFGYCVVFSECGLAVTWLCRQMLKWVPSLAIKLRVVFIDGLLATTCITVVFPNAQILLCSWHLVFQAIPRSLARLCKGAYQAAYDCVIRMQNAETEAACERNTLSLSPSISRHSHLYKIYIRITCTTEQITYNIHTLV